MSKSCEGHCELPPGRGARPCPQCGQKGKAVSTLTVKSLIKDHTWVAPGDYLFCRTPACDVVYFSERQFFRKPELKVRVGLKETGDPIPLCYCFDYLRSDIVADIEEKGSTNILERIKSEVAVGYCACEVKNPSGACCLGDVTRAIQETTALLQARSAPVLRE